VRKRNGLAIGISQALYLSDAAGDAPAAWFFTRRREAMSASAEPRPEQTFFADPALDRLMGVVMALATEVYVLRDRLRALEARLAESGTLRPGALDADPSPEELAASAAEREAFVANLLEPLLGLEASKSLPPDAPHGRSLLDPAPAREKR
jgi:hypothetical protein